MATSGPEPTEEVVDDRVPQPERSLREKGIENLISYGLSPQGAVYFWDCLINLQKFGITGVLFAVLSYFFFDGTYLRMFGLYLVYHNDVLDCILYELVVMLPSDVSFFEIFVLMEVSVAYLLIGAFYLLTAMILEVSGFFIRQLLRLPSGLAIVLRYLVAVQLSLMYSVGLGGLPWYLEFPLGILLATQGLRFYTSGLLALVRWILSALPDDLAISTLRIAVIYLPQIWRAISRGLQRTRELLLRILQVLAPLLSFRRHNDQPYTYIPLRCGDEIRLLCLSGKLWGLQIQGKLVHAHIDNLPPYECISYRWGDSTEKKAMVLNGRNFRVSASVYNILLQRRAVFSRRLIWIDSVCIYVYRYRKKPSET